MDGESSEMGRAACHRGLTKSWRITGWGRVEDLPLVELFVKVHALGQFRVLHTICQRNVEFDGIIKVLDFDLRNDCVFS